MSLSWPTLRNRALARLLLGFGLMNLAEWGFVTALSVHAFRVGGTLDVGLIGLRLLAGAVSSAVLAPLFASRSGALSGVSLLRACLLGAAAATVISGSPYLVALVFVVADSVVAAVYRPAQSRLMPSLARSPIELTHAVAGTSMAKTIGQAAGALIAGGAVELVSPGAAMAGEAGVMLLALLCSLGLRGAPAIDSGRTPNRVRDGLAAFPEVLGNVSAWPLVVASVLRTLVRGLWGALLVVVALHLLRGGSSSVGLLQASTGIGVLIALPVTATQIGRAELALPCIASFVSAGVAVGLIGATSALPVVVVLVFIWGAAMAFADATSISLLHRVLPSRLFSRTVAVMESMKLVSEGAGALLAPALVALFGLRSALVIAGLPLPVLMFFTWVRVRRSDELAAGRGFVVSMLHGVELFHGLDMASLEQVAAATTEVSIQTGEQPITQGDTGDRFYVIESGRADVLIDGFRVREIGPGEGFGERALLRNTPRTATIRALTEMRLLAVDRDAFLQALTGESGVIVAYRDLVDTPTTELLRMLAMFDGLSDQGLQRVADAASVREFAADAVVFDVGDAPDAAYVIRSGRVELREGPRLSSVLVAGDVFGELSVLRQTPRARAAVVAESAVLEVLPAAIVLAEVAVIDASA
jgi:CRP-like cAMP-binding protein